jgi:hypothetical protein
VVAQCRDVAAQYFKAVAQCGSVMGAQCEDVVAQRVNVLAQ